MIKFILGALIVGLAWTARGESEFAIIALIQGIVLCNLGIVDYTRRKSLMHL